VPLAVERFDQRRDSVAPKPREGALGFRGDPAVAALELGDPIPGFGGVRPFPQPPLQRLAFTQSDRGFAPAAGLGLGDWLDLGCRGGPLGRLFAARAQRQ
jgi:hypothetical protein